MSGATPGGGTGEAASQRTMTSSLCSSMSSTMSGPGGVAVEGVGDGEGYRLVGGAVDKAFLGQ